MLATSVPNAWAMDAPASPRLALRVPLHHAHILVLQLPAGEGTHAHVQEVLERLPPADPAAPRRLLDEMKTGLVSG